MAAVLSRIKDLPERPVLVAIGKAAPAMAAGACSALAARGGISTGLVVTKTGHCGQYALPPGLPCREAGHPWPDARSLAAGQALLATLQALPDGSEVLVLLSGGASALIEVLPEGVTLEDLARANAWLLGSGLDIVAINRVRKRLSCIKGGRLAAYLAGHRVLQLVLPDVPGDRLEDVGSAPLIAADEAQSLLPANLPDWLRGMLDAAPPLARPGDPGFEQITSRCLGGNAAAREAACQAGRAVGLTVHQHEDLLTGEAAEAGERLADELLAGAPGLHVWGGETTVRLPAQPGVGGRNQHLALAAARRLAGHAGVFLLAVGTDGTDGPTEDAGALVDGETVARGETEGWSAADCLVRADTSRFLAASGDLVHTGPTGTNVMDLVLALKITVV